MDYRSADGRKVGRMAAFMMGLPNEISGYILTVLLICIPIALFAPAILSLRGRTPKGFLGLSLWQRCLCVLLSYVMLVPPAWLESVVYGSCRYSQITTGDWATHKFVEYAYDDNGSCTAKTTRNSANAAVEVVTYDYNLQNKLRTATTDPISGSTVSVTQYTYDDQGIRVRSVSYDMPRGGGTHTNETTTTYLIDQQNHTGYAQTLEESDGATRTTYTIGDDIVTQSAYDGSSATTRHILYDGHGSTRQLTDNTGAVATDQVFNYDAYGVMVGYSGTPQTNLLYSGEYFDAGLKQYNLRARNYDPLNGRFTSLDPYAGNTSDPQSLHKYTYCHNNPVNGVDPSGMRLGPGLINLILTVGVIGALRILVGIRATYTLAEAYVEEMKATRGMVDTNRWIGRLTDEDMKVIKWIDAFKTRPDIVDRERYTVYEVKHNTSMGIAAGRVQIGRYLATLAARYPTDTRMFTPGTWRPQKTWYPIMGLPGLPNIGPLRIQAHNAGWGVIAYDINNDDFNRYVFIVASCLAFHMALRAKQVDVARAQAMTSIASLMTVMLVIL
jgi:RHS repeat-associated protein